MSNLSWWQSLYKNGMQNFYIFCRYFDIINSVCFQIDWIFLPSLLNYLYRIVMFLNNIHNFFRHVIGMARNVRRATVLLPSFDGVLALECDSRRPKCAKRVLVLRMFARLVFSTSSTVSSIHHIDLTIFFNFISRVTII